MAHRLTRQLQNAHKQHLLQNHSNTSFFDLKKLGLGFGIAAGASLMLYGVYRFYKTYSDKQRVKHGETLTGEELLKFNLDQDIRKIGTVSLTEQMLIPFDKFVEMFRCIRNHSKVKIDVIIGKMKTERRETLKNSSTDLSNPSKIEIDEAYSTLVRDQMMIEEKIYQETSDYLLEELGFNQEQFQKCQEIYMSSPQFQQRFFFAMQQDDNLKAKLESPQTPAVLSEKDKVKEMFVFTEITKLQVAMFLDSRMKGNQQIGIDITVEAMVMQSYMQDKFFLVYGFEEDMFYAAVRKLKLSEDPEVRERIQESLKSLPPDLMQRITSQLVHGGSCANSCCSGADNEGKVCTEACCPPQAQAHQQQPMDI